MTKLATNDKIERYKNLSKNTVFPKITLIKNEKEVAENLPIRRAPSFRPPF